MEYIPAKTIVNRTKSTAWFGADYNMNIYRGCVHGCIYCDSRSECYGIFDFDKVCAKENALMIIRNDLRRKVRRGVIATGAMSDPYNPYEQELKLTRNALELINAFGFGVAISTKSDLITRDIDILCDIKAHSPVIINITITTFDEKLCSIIEPNAAGTQKRFEAIKQLADNGIFCGVLLMPILPYVNDTQGNIENIVRSAKECGARFIYPAFGVTLRQNQRDYFYIKLDEHFPGLKEKYIKRYGNRYSCASPKVNELTGVFLNECTKTGMLHRMNDIINVYKSGYKPTQLSFIE